jgi:acetyl-CoA synthetase
MSKIPTGDDIIPAFPLKRRRDESSSNIEAADESSSWEEYLKRYSYSLTDPRGFWSEEVSKYISFFSPPSQICDGNFDAGDVRWFVDGKLNAAHNCIDRHLSTKAEQTAIIWESDEPREGRNITYGELAIQVSKIANVMKSYGVKKGDVVTIYMPMIPELPMVMLACARIGAVHSVVFAGFSADSLRDRILDCNSQWIFTSDEGKRGGKTLKLKETVDAVHSFQYLLL